MSVTIVRYIVMHIPYVSLHNVVLWAILAIVAIFRGVQMRDSKRNDRSRPHDFLDKLVDMLHIRHIFECMQST